MNRAHYAIGILLAVTSWTTRQALAEDTLTAEGFAARCADAEGNLALAGNVSVVGGNAELGPCRVELGPFRLEIQQARFSSIGPFFVNGGLSGGELRFEHSQISQSERAELAVNIDLIAHRLRAHDTTIDSFGHVILRGGDADRSDVLVESVRFRVRSPTVLHIGASGQTSHHGRITVRDSELVSEGDVSIQASFLPQRGDEATIDAQELVARCADAGGVLTLHTDLHVVGGAAQTEECHIVLDFSRLVIERIQLSATGFFLIDGQPGGELRIERSTLAQSSKEGRSTSSCERIT